MNDSFIATLIVSISPEIDNQIFLSTSLDLAIGDTKEEYRDSKPLKLNATSRKQVEELKLELRDCLRQLKGTIFP